MNDSFRIIDANANRAAEGIRVIEDYCRFLLRNEMISKQLRQIRHDIRDAVGEKYLLGRDSINDFGKKISSETNIDLRKNEKQLVNANFKRAEEAVRVLEEMLKIEGDYESSRKMEYIRFDIYNAEVKVNKLIKRIIPEGIYGITDERSSQGRSNIETVREMAGAGIKIVQYREKYKTYKEKYSDCLEIRKITSDYGMTFIVNDHIDIAMLTDADGIHMGQDDLPIGEIRKLVGNKIIGYSTHSPEQAAKAVEDGADYIGVGPIFRTYTKDNVCDPVGLEYLEYAVKNIKIPFVAIGGIKEGNLCEIASRGAKRICLVTEITSSKDIKEKIEDLKSIISQCSEMEKLN